MKEKITYELANHKGQNVIFIRFKYDSELIKRVKALVGIKWSQTHKAWYVLDTPQYRSRFGLKIDFVGKKVLSQVNTVNQSALTRLIETVQLKGYSDNTLKTYRNEFARLLYVLKDKKVDDLDSERLRSYFLYCINTLKLSENTLHSRINAVKFYFEQVLHREKFFFDILRPKKHLQIPTVFSVEDVQAIIKHTENQKHKTILMMCYASGLRVSEVVGLKIKDIDSKRMVIYILRAKGKKDRIVPLSVVLLNNLRDYFKAFKPKEYLFEGQYTGQAYTARSIQVILDASKQKAKVKQKGSTHALRHSYATHQLDKGVDITYIQKILGHNDIKTTLRYLHVTTRDLNKIKSPLDDMDF